MAISSKARSAVKILMVFATFSILIFLQPVFKHWYESWIGIYTLSTPNVELGVLFLGLFIGGLLGLGLSNTVATLKAVITAIGAGLGSGPLVFMKSSGDALWMYPIGLVIGLCWLRFFTARKLVSDKRRKLSERLWAWIDMIIIVTATTIAMVYAAL